MASSNPFRKRQPTERFPPIEAIDTTGDAVDDEAAGPESPAPPAQGKAEAKPVKKVRVLSPPPLSPDSPAWPSNASAYASAALADSDRFTHDHQDDAVAGAPPPLQQQQQQQYRAQPSTTTTTTTTTAQPPANPFSKTLQDVEDARLEAELHQERRDEGAALKAANAARRSLNVDSFRRLLMTGDAGLADTPSSDSSVAGEATPSTTPSSAAVVSDNAGLPGDGSRRQQQQQQIDSSSPDDEDDDLDAGSMSDSSINVQIGTRGKKTAPPPPSSRHGKSLKVELKKDTSQSPPSSTKSPPTDINKPLPPPPVHGSALDDAESPFDQEAAGKTPELEPLPLAPPPPVVAQQKRNIPAPPPRRRGDTKSTPSASRTSSSRFDDEDTASIGEGLSRSSSIRQNTSAPAPPPPRRQNAGGRPLSGVLSPSASYSSAPTPASPPSLLAEPEHQQQHYTASPEQSESPPPAAGKTAAPPPPPTRNASVRRPLSLHSADSTSRRTSSETKVPPPPPRPRGSSRSSVEGIPTRTSLDRAARPRVVTEDTASEDGAAAQGKGVDILADLTALQREVDALRGKLT